MNYKIVTNQITEKSTYDVFTELAKSSKKVIIAVAFFTDSKIIKSLLDSGIQIDLIVSLRPPTSYYALKEILHLKNISIRYLGDSFHSKIFTFHDEKFSITHALIGSSNFTNGGLLKNIETNIVVDDTKTLESIFKTINAIKNVSAQLQPDVLNTYKKRYDSFVKYKEKDKKYSKQTQKKRTNKKLSNVALQYLDFWRVADEVKEIVAPVCKQEYPRVPQYIAIDHFWHWIVVEKKLTRLSVNSQRRKIRINKLFKSYCEWDKNTNNDTRKMGRRSRRLQKLLSVKKIPKLTTEEVLRIYGSLHATQALIQRFNADEEFIANNSLKDIRTSFAHLLDDKIPIVERIHDLTHAKSKYKLSGFGNSCVQELIGWVNPDKMPIRNIKADNAIHLLGFR